MRNPIKFAVIALLLFLATSCRWVSTTETVSLQPRINHELNGQTADEILTHLGQPSSVASDTLGGIEITKFRYEDAVMLLKYAEYSEKYQKENPWMDVYLKKGRTYSVKTNMVTTKISKDEYTISIIKLGTYAGILLFIVAIVAIVVIITRKNDIDELESSLFKTKKELERKLKTTENEAFRRIGDTDVKVNLLSMRVNNIQEKIKKIENASSIKLSNKDIRRLLDYSLDVAGISTKTKGILKAAGTYTIRDLVTKDPAEYRKYRGFGPKSLKECENYLTRYGLRFGMDLSAFNAPDEPATESAAEEQPQPEAQPEQQPEPKTEEVPSEE